jgi:hypothetical protein
MKWRCDTKSIITEASEYECLVKTRPSPISMSVLPAASPQPLLEINVNLPTIAHRACAKLESGFLSEVELEWELNFNLVQSRNSGSPSFILKNNNEDSPKAHCFATSKQ